MHAKGGVTDEMREQSKQLGSDIKSKNKSLKILRHNSMICIYQFQILPERCASW